MSKTKPTRPLPFAAQVRAYLLKHHKTGTFTTNDITNGMKAGDTKARVSSELYQLKMNGKLAEVGEITEAAGRHYTKITRKVYRVILSALTPPPTVKQIKVKVAKKKEEFVSIALREQQMNETGIALENITRLWGRAA